jgi:hypothetical protein
MTTAEAKFAWLEDVATMTALVPAAVERGADPDLARYLAQSGGMQRNVNRWNNRHLPDDAMAYWAIEEFVLREARGFEPPKVARPKGVRKGRNTFCFMNAARIALDHEHLGWQYVEGYATSDFGFSVHHAWVLDAEGTVIETTWQKPGQAYLGVVFSMDELRTAILATGTWGVFGETLLEAPYNPLTFKARLALERRKSK